MLWEAFALSFFLKWRLQSFKNWFHWILRRWKPRRVYRLWQLRLRLHHQLSGVFSAGDIQRQGMCIIHMSFPVYFVSLCKKKRLSLFRSARTSAPTTTRRCTSESAIVSTLTSASHRWDSRLPIMLGSSHFAPPSPPYPLYTTLHFHCPLLPDSIDNHPRMALVQQPWRWILGNFHKRPCMAQCPTQTKVIFCLPSSNTSMASAKDRQGKIAKS